MIATLAIAILLAAGIALLAIALPCTACEKRRERMRAALQDWQRRQR